jgi:hypothetical protein
MGTPGHGAPMHVSNDLYKLDFYRFINSTLHLHTLINLM